MLVFLDSNVLVYAVDPRDKRKMRIAEDLNDGQFYCDIKAVNPFK